MFVRPELNQGSAEQGTIFPSIHLDQKPQSGVEHAGIGFQLHRNLIQDVICVQKYP
jgi:hypothetical protein